MDASIPVQEIVTSTCTLLSVCTCSKYATFTDLVTSCMSKIAVQAMWWLGYLVPEMCIKNIMPIASQDVEPDNTKWQKIIQSNTSWEEIIQSVQRVCQRFDMLSRFLGRELKDTGPISGLPVMYISLSANHISGNLNEFPAVNLGTIGQKGLFLLNFGLFWHYFEFFANGKNSQKKLVKDMASRIRPVIQHI